MLVELPALLNAAQLDKLRALASSASTDDGRLTAGKVAAKVKRNQELAFDDEAHGLLQRVLMSALGHDARFRSAALPLRMADFIVARYLPGMAYGEHTDDPVMGMSGPKFRADLALTVFLNDPQDYRGGELAVRTAFGEQRVKLAAGAAVLYPASSLHRVCEVETGERLVALTWVQSLVRDPARRELLYELDQVRDYLFDNAPDADQTRLMQRSYANLLRMWAEV